MRVYLVPNDVFVVEKHHQPVKTATNVAPRSRISLAMIFPVIIVENKQVNCPRA
jgi:hypothetical protein